MNRDPKTPLKTIIDACRQGDESAQFALYERFYAYTLTVSLHYCKDRNAAEEVVQDTFVKVFRRLDSLRGADTFKPWLRTIIVRTAINHFRAHHHWKKRLQMEALQHHQ